MYGTAHNLYPLQCIIEEDEEQSFITQYFEIAAVFVGLGRQTT